MECPPRLFLEYKYRVGQEKQKKIRRLFWEGLEAIVCRGWVRGYVGWR